MTWGGMIQHIPAPAAVEVSVFIIIFRFLLFSAILKFPIDQLELQKSAISMPAIICVVFGASTIDVSLIESRNEYFWIPAAYQKIVALCITRVDWSCLPIEGFNKIARLQLAYESIVEKFTGVLFFCLWTSLSQLVQNRPHGVCSGQGNLHHVIWLLGYHRTRKGDPYRSCGDTSTVLLW